MATPRQAAAVSKGIGIKEITTVTFEATDGRSIHPGDIIVADIKGQDIVGTFEGLDKDGYFNIKPVYTASETVRYRPSTIKSCYRLSSYELEIDKPQEVAAEAAEEAGAGALSPAS